MKQKQNGPFDESGHIKHLSELDKALRAQKYLSPDERIRIESAVRKEVQKTREGLSKEAFEKDIKKLAMKPKDNIKRWEIGKLKRLENN